MTSATIFSAPNQLGPAQTGPEQLGPDLSMLDRFGSIMAGLRAAVAAHFRAPGMSGPLVLLICRRLRRVEAEVRAVMARIVAGHLTVSTARAPRVRPCRQSGTDASMRLPVRQAGPARPVLPRGFAWLCRLVPYQAAGCGSQLRSVLAEPEMAALIEATPRLARALRPLCQMLAIEGFAWLKPACTTETPGREHPAPCAADDPSMARSDDTGSATTGETRWSGWPPGTVSADVWLRLPEPVWPNPVWPDPAGIAVRRDAQRGDGPESCMRNVA